MKRVNSKVYILLISILVIGLVLIGCEQPTTPPTGGATPSATTGTTAVKDLKVGAAVTLTGAFAADCISWWHGLNAAADWYNSKGGLNIAGQSYKFRLISEDSQMTPDGGIAAANKLLLDEKVKFFTSNDIPFIAAAEVDLAEKVGAFSMNPSVMSPGELSPKRPLTFACMDLGSSIKPCYDYLVKAYPAAKKIALLFPDDPSLGPFQARVKSECEKHGLTIVDVESYPIGTTDFYPILTKALAANPEIIDGGLGAAGWWANILKQSREKGFTGPVFCCTTVGDPLVIREAATAKYSTDFFVANVSLTDPSLPQTLKDVVKQISSKYTETMTINHLFGYNTLWYMAQAINAAQSVDPAAVAKAFENMTTMETAYGPATIGGQQTWGNKHLVLAPVGISTLMNGEIKIVGFFPADVP